MSPRAALPPTPAELAAWLRAASPRTAHGRYRWSPAESDASRRFLYAGRRPVIAAMPPDVEVEFWHAALHSWRVEGPDGPLCASDGRTAVVWGKKGPQVGAALIMGFGPDGLLHLTEQDTAWTTRPGPELPASGTVERDSLLGRLCWRWESAEWTVWVDEQTGCALRLDDEQGSRVLTAFDVDVEVDPARFAPPEGGVVPAPAPEPPGRAGEAPPEPTGTEAPTASFSVPWWPDGASGHPVDGDAAVPELLVELHTSGEGAPRFWIGVAPAGTPARVRGGCRVRRWDGDGWSFALSWRGDVPDDDLERLVASTPRSWT